MKRLRYEPAFASAIIAVGGGVDLLIPPSIILVERGRFLWKPLRPERPSTRPDAAADSRIGREQFTGPHAI
jgi:hypothetical protein